MSDGFLVFLFIARLKLLAEGIFEELCNRRNVLRGSPLGLSLPNFPTNHLVPTKYESRRLSSTQYARGMRLGEEAIA